MQGVRRQGLSVIFSLCSHLDGLLLDGRHAGDVHAVQVLHGGREDLVVHTALPRPLALLRAQRDGLEPLHVSNSHKARDDCAERVPVLPRNRLPVHLVRHDGVAVGVQGLLDRDGGQHPVVGLELDVLDAHPLRRLGGVHPGPRQQSSKRDSGPLRIADGPNVPRGALRAVHAVQAAPPIPAALHGGHDFLLLKVPLQVLEAQPDPLGFLLASAPDGDRKVQAELRVVVDRLHRHGVVMPDVPKLVWGDPAVHEKRGWDLRVHGLGVVDGEGRVGGGLPREGIGGVGLPRQTLGVLGVEHADLHLSKELLHRLVPKVLLIHPPERVHGLSRSEHDLRRPARVVLHELRDIVHLISSYHPYSRLRRVVLLHVRPAEHSLQVAIMLLLLLLLKMFTGLLTVNRLGFGQEA